MNGLNLRTAVGRQILVCCALASLVCVGESVGQVVDSEESSAICDDNGRLQSDAAGLESRFVLRIDVLMEDIDSPEVMERTQRLEFLVQMNQGFRVLHSEEDAKLVVEGVLTDAEDGKVSLQYSIAYQRGSTKRTVTTSIELTPENETYLVVDRRHGPVFTGTLLPFELVSEPPDTP